MGGSRPQLGNRSRKTPRPWAAKWNQTKVNARHQVEDEEDTEDDAGAEHGGEQDVELPALAAERLVDARRDVAGRRAEQHVQHQHARHQRSAIGRRHEAQAREY